MLVRVVWQMSQRYDEGKASAASRGYRIEISHGCLVDVWKHGAKMCGGCTDRRIMETHEGAMGDSIRDVSCLCVGMESCESDTGESAFLLFHTRSAGTGDVCDEDSSRHARCILDGGCIAATDGHRPALPDGAGHRRG